MQATSTDRIERTVRINAPRSRVWNALTNAASFGEWFEANLEGDFQVGQSVKGHSRCAGYEHVAFDMLVERMEPEHTFAWRWHPFAVDSNVDYSKEPRTLVVFTLADDNGGTRLTVIESGFDSVPAERRDLAFRMHDGGWTEQVENITRYVTKA